MTIRILTMLVALCLCVGASPALAKEHLPKEKSVELRIGELDPRMQRALAAALKDLGIEMTPAMTYKGDTTGCPSNCNDSYSGGMCRCTTGDDGKCPSGTSNPGTGNECTTTKSKGVVTGGGLKQPLQVETSTGF